MEKADKILVAGYTGLVGSAIVRRLQKARYDNLLLKDHRDVNMTRQAEVEELFKKERPEYVFLAAAKVGGIMANSTYTADFIYINMMIAANIIHTAYKTGVKKLINLGSSCIYPRLAPQPMREDSLLTGLLEPTNEAYAIAKIAAIKLCHYYNQQYGMNFISVMPTNQYGIGDNFNMETAHLLPMVIRRFHLANLLRKEDWNGIRGNIRRNKLGWNLDTEVKLDDPVSLEKTLAAVGAFKDKVVMWGDGSVYRELMCSDDLADACLFLMENKDCKDIGEHVNVTSGMDIQLNSLFEMVKKITGFEGSIVYDTSKPNGMPRKLMDATKILSLGWAPKISLEQGIRDFYSWYAGA